MIILATNSSKHLGLANGVIQIGRFPDGEVSVVLKEDVKGKEVLIIGGTEPPSDNLMELLLSIDTVSRHGAKTVNVLIPYLGYGKSDREKVKGQPISSRVLINLIESIGGRSLNVTVLDIHSKKVEDFFTVPHKNVSLMKTLSAKYIKEKDFKIVSPDEGGIERAKEFAGFLGLNEIITIKKERLADSAVKILRVSGKVKGKNLIIVDDMVQSGGTIEEAVRVLKEKGAEKISLAVTHMVYSAGGWQKMADNVNIDRVVTTNTIKPLNNLPAKFEVVNIAPFLSSAIFQH
jgi:ribose-phosphate pyrophosphokinase